MLEKKELEMLRRSSHTKPQMYKGVILTADPPEQSTILAMEKKKSTIPCHRSLLPKLAAHKEGQVALKVPWMPMPAGQMWMLAQTAATLQAGVLGSRVAAGRLS